jgi:hypothetical protein
MRIESVGTPLVVGLLGCSGEAPPSAPGAPSGNADVQVGECEGSGYRAAAAEDSGSAAEPAVWVEAGADGSVVVHLDDVTANCCPSPAATFATDGTDVSLTFVDVSAETSCDCWCVTDFVVTSEPLEPGAYDVAVDYNGEGQGTFPVTIP